MTEPPKPNPNPTPDPSDAFASVLPLIGQLPGFMADMKRSDRRGDAMNAKLNLIMHKLGMPEWKDTPEYAKLKAEWDAKTEAGKKK